MEVRPSISSPWIGDNESAKGQEDLSWELPRRNRHVSDSTGAGSPQQMRHEVLRDGRK